VNAFQLDEGFNYKPLIGACRLRKQCEIRPWPEPRVGQKDPIWIPDICSLDAPVVSKDFTIATNEENRRAMPETISGFIIPKPTRKKVRPFRADHAQQILETFKEKFPRWHETDWTNTYVEVRDTDVSVTHIADCVDMIGPRILFDSPNFVAVLVDAIAAARKRRTNLIPRDV